MNKILVIIPMYNAEDFIEETLSSILSQNVPVSIIVVNDASTDSSKSKILKFPQVTLISNSINKGTYYSINVALKYASSDPSWNYYCIHGADDVSIHGRFKKQLSFFKDDSCLAVGCGFRRIDFSSKKIISTNIKTNESVLLFSRKVFDSIGYYDIARVGCDTEYKKRLLLFQKESIIQINEILIHSYLHNNNLTKKIPLGGPVRQEYVKSFIKIHEKMKEQKNFYLPFTQN